MKIIYVYDALCGWCYGFAPVIEKLQATHPDWEFEVVSGGMITGSRTGPIGEVAPYIKQAYKVVEQRTGVTFGKAFLQNILEEGSTVFTSIPPARALALFKQTHPAQAVTFAGKLQHAIYHNGMPPGNWEALGKLAGTFGLDADSFAAQLQTEAVAAAAEKDFARAGALGVTGFPTVFVEKEGRIYKIAEGYVDFTQLEAQLKRLQ